MKKKSRRSGRAEETKDPATEDGTVDKASDDGTVDEPVAAGPSDEPIAEPTRDASTSDDAPKTRSLPAFGFAADLLRQHRSGAAEGGGGGDGEAGGDGDDGDRYGGALEAGPAPAELTSTVDIAEAGAVEAKDPNRVFDFADRLGDAAGREQEPAAPVKIGTFVAFDLAGETYAIPVEPVRQVVRVSSITRVPHAPRPIRGVTNLRGRVIPVIDLRLRIGLEETRIERSSRVVSVASRGRLIGLLVDAVHQVVHLDLYRVQPPPDDVMTLQSDYIEGVYGEGDDLILLLDIDKALIIREAGAA